MRKKFNTLACLFVSLIMLDSAHAMKRGLDDPTNPPSKRQKPESAVPEKLPFEDEANQLDSGYRSVLDTICGKYLESKATVPHGNHINITVQGNGKLEEYFHLEPTEFQPLWRKLLKDLRVKEGERNLIADPGENTDKEIVDIILKAIPEQWEDNLYMLLSSPFFGGFHSKAYIELKINKLRQNSPCRDSGTIFFCNNQLVLIFDTIKAKDSEPNTRELVREERVFEFQLGGEAGLLVDVITKDVVDIEDIFYYMTPRLAPYKILED